MLIEKMVSFLSAVLDMELLNMGSDKLGFSAVHYFKLIIP